jgi:hypothetical protein
MWHLSYILKDIILCIQQKEGKKSNNATYLNNLKNSKEA